MITRQEFGPKLTETILNRATADYAGSREPSKIDHPIFRPAIDLCWETMSVLDILEKYGRLRMHGWMTEANTSAHLYEVNLSDGKGGERKVRFRLHDGTVEVAGLDDEAARAIDSLGATLGQASPANRSTLSYRTLDQRQQSAFTDVFADMLLRFYG